LNLTEKTEDQIERNKRLIGLYQNNVRSEGSKLFKVLPQGANSGLNADLLDGQHAEEIVAKAVSLSGKRKGGGGGGGVGGGDMTQAVYDTDTDNVVESADNADTVDGVHAADIDADTVDGVHAAGFFAGTWVTGTCTGSNPITTPHGLGGVPSLVLYAINALQPYAASYNADVTNIIFYHNAAASLTIKWAARL
jgi:hypothetical protein